MKSGHVSVAFVRDLRGVVERERAEVGVLLTLEEPTKPMQVEAASAGFYKSAFHPAPGNTNDRGIATGQAYRLPAEHQCTHKRAPKAAAAMPEQFILAPSAAPDYSEAKAAPAKPKNVISKRRERK